MKSTKKLIKRINKADSKNVESLRRYWSDNGYKYYPWEWADVWEAFTNRNLELSGVDIPAPAF